MTAREENKQLKEEIENSKRLNEFLMKKIEHQSQELMKAAKDKGSMSSLRKKIRYLQDENARLNDIVMEYERPGSNVIDIRMRQTENHLRELEIGRAKQRQEILQKMDKIATLEFELKQTRAYMVNLPPYGNIPKEIFDYVKSLENEIQLTRSKYYSASDRYNLILKYLTDIGHHDNVEEYLSEYTKKRRGARQKISSEKIRTIQELRKGGVSIRDIASTVGVSVGSVHRYLKQK